MHTVFAQRLLGEYRVPKDSSAGRSHLERCVEARRRSEESEANHGLRRRWCLGGNPFGKELLEGMGVRLGPEHYEAER